MTNILVLDTSGSMNEEDYSPTRLYGAIEASEAFIKEKQRQDPQSYIGLIGFSNDVDATFPPEKCITSSEALISKLKSLKAWGGTNFSGGLEGAELFFKKHQYNPGSAITLEPVMPVKTRKKQLVFLSDGFNNGGDPLPICDRLKASGVLISCVGIGGSPAAVDEKLLREMASPSSYRFIKDSKALVTEFKRLANICIAE